MIPSMRIVPLYLEDANNLVTTWHRHHDASQGHRFSLGVVLATDLIGAAIVGRPVAGATDQRNIAEIVRLVTDGISRPTGFYNRFGEPTFYNPCSMLYAACANSAKFMGYESIQTFILETEPGTSLIAAGFKKIGRSSGGDWSRSGRLRDSKNPQGPKTKWARELNSKVEYKLKESITEKSLGDLGL